MGWAESGERRAESGERRAESGESAKRKARNSNNHLGSERRSRRHSDGSVFHAADGSTFAFCRASFAGERGRRVRRTSGSVGAARGRRAVGGGTALRASFVRSAVSGLASFSLLGIAGKRWQWPRGGQFGPRRRPGLRSRLGQCPRGNGWGHVHGHGHSHSYDKERNGRGNSRGRVRGRPGSRHSLRRPHPRRQSRRSPCLRSPPPRSRQRQGNSRGRPPLGPSAQSRRRVGPRRAGFHGCGSSDSRGHGRDRVHGDSHGDVQFTATSTATATAGATAGAAAGAKSAATFVTARAAAYQEAASASASGARPPRSASRPAEAARSSGRDRGPKLRPRWRQPGGCRRGRSN